MDLARFRKRPLLGILRGISEKSLEPLLEAAEDGGLEALEITMNTQGARDLIARAVKLSSGRLMIGAGTVLSVEELKGALDAGAGFIVMPVLVPEVAGYCTARKIPVFPGALCPQEVYQAWAAGASMVKIFPAGLFGPSYFRDLKGPFRDIDLLACSGVTPENIGEYFACGASAATVGAGVFRREWIDAGEFARISVLLRKYIGGMEKAIELRNRR